MFSVDTTSAGFQVKIGRGFLRDVLEKKPILYISMIPVRQTGTTPMFCKTEFLCQLIQAANKEYSGNSLTSAWIELTYHICVFNSRQSMCYHQHCSIYHGSVYGLFNYGLTLRIQCTSGLI